MTKVTQEEWLDVVDQNDHVIGTKTRADIHALGLMHRAVHILVLNAYDEVFLQKRSMSKSVNPGLWDTSAAGHVDSGESYDHAAARELEEELGIPASNKLDFLFRLPPDADNGFEHCQVYMTRYDGEMQLEEGEIDDGKWLSGEALDQLISHDDPTLTTVIKCIWQQYRALN